MIGFLLNNNLVPIGFSVISTCSLADLFEQRARNVPLASTDVLGVGRLRDKPKERLLLGQHDMSVGKSHLTEFIHVCGRCPAYC